jgi:hypothetical protein
MKFTIPSELETQMRGDSISGIHIRDFISVDIELDGSYTTDWDAPDKLVVLKDEYIQKISSGLEGWFNSLSSDSSFYTNLDGDWLNLHAETIEDFAKELA